MILIAGAGLAGLSAAFHLQDRDFRIIEREERPGGLCRTERIGDYSFDYGGHLLHLRGDDVRGLVMDLLGDRLRLHKRRSAIFSKGVVTPYPFQVNTYGLPPEVVRDCLLGFIEAMMDSTKDPSVPDNFFEWIYHAFGQGFAKHFFLPFNQKFFKTDLTEITTEWASWSIPRPRPRDVVNGALGIEEGEFGYNVEFYYPGGGIEELPRARFAPPFWWKRSWLRSRWTRFSTSFATISPDSTADVGTTSSVLSSDSAIILKWSSPIALRLR